MSRVLDSWQCPGAILTLPHPIALASIPGGDETVSAIATGDLARDGVKRSVDLALTARSDGSVPEARGSAPVLASRRGIKTPLRIHDALHEITISYNRIRAAVGS